jgi:hypothetical protein
MTNLFQFLMYMIFGKYWIKYEMIQGYKMALFVNEAEIVMNKIRVEEATERKALLEKGLLDLENSSLKVTDSSDHKENSKEEYKARQEREHQVKTFKNQIKSAETDRALAEGELDRIYSITYGARRKYDFMNSYKVTSTYADKN